MDPVTDFRELAGWIPIRLYWQDQQAMVDWCYLGPGRFTDSFFSETVAECLRLPFNQIFRPQTSIEILRQLHDQGPGLQPTGFIFHMSRCGSTLVSQMLAALESNIVISEAPLLDWILSSEAHRPEVTGQRRVEWLHWLVSTLGQPRIGNERNLFVKLDSWQILFFPLIRQAFPDVPWLFLYRDPVEVMVSQFDQRGAHMVPGVIAPELFGMDLQIAVTLTPEQYCATVLATICQAALRHHEDGGRLINYTQLPESVWSSVLDFFQVSFSESEIDTMRNAAKRDAKNPENIFADDTARKKQKATPAIQEAVAEKLYPVYQELEAARLQSDAAAGISS